MFLSVGYGFICTAHEFMVQFIPRALRWEWFIHGRIGEAARLRCCARFSNLGCMFELKWTFGDCCLLFPRVPIVFPDLNLIFHRVPVVFLDMSFVEAEL